MESTALRPKWFGTTVAQELLVAVTGLAMVGFIFGHLLGNFLIFKGPEAFNAYAHHLQSLGPLLWAARIGLITALVLHVWTTVALYWSNWGARGSRYAVTAYRGRKPFPTRIMIFTGIIIFAFLGLHLYDFTFAVKEGAGTIVEGMGDGAELGLFGLVWNSFANPLRSLLYLAAVWSVGFHFAHALASIWVTLGLMKEGLTGKAEAAAWLIGAAVALGFSLIPLYVLCTTYVTGV